MQHHATRARWTARPPRGPAPRPGIDHGDTGRRDPERGAAILEFTLVSIPLMLILLGGIMLGFLLTVRQSVTQAAKEAARAGLLLYDATDGSVGYTGAEQEAVTRACQILADLESRVDGDCDTIPPGSPMSVWDDPDRPVQYYAKVHDCDTGTDEAAVRADTPDPATPTCLFVRIRYNHESHRILPAVPLIDVILPDAIRSVASVQIS